MEDPLISFILPFRRTRKKTLLKFFRPYSELNIKNKRAFGVGEPLQGVAYWKFPAQDSLSIGVSTLGKFLPLVFTLYPIGLFRASVVLKQIDALHAKHAPEPHFYLDNLGVLPSSQGKGLSASLVRPFLKMADEQKAAVNTDTVLELNVPYYEHFGFQLMEERIIEGKGITVYALKRLPQ